MSTLFFADDGILLANSEEEAEKMVDILMSAGKEVGLEINRKKAK